MQFPKGELTNFSDGTTVPVKQIKVTTLGGTNTVVEANSKSKKVTVSLYNAEILFFAKGITIGGWQRRKDNNCIAEYISLDLYL